MSEEVIYGKCIKCGGPLLAGHECSGTFQDFSKTVAKLAVDTAKRTKGIYVGAPACFALEMACQHLSEAFGECCYLVGSALERADWRDIDVRMILDDEAFAELFPAAHVHTGSWEFDARWLVMTVSISAWLSKESGLPVDFQFQPRAHANERHKKPRNALGMRMAPRSETEGDAK